MTDLESQQIPAEPVTPTTASPAVAGPPEPAPEPEVADQTYKDQRGQDVIPLKTFISQRDELKAIKAQLAQEKAQREQVQQAWTQWEPYARALAARPDVVAQLTQTAPSRTAPEAPAADPEAEALARELDLYTTTGQPDVARAQRMLRNVIDRRVQEQVQAAVEPLQAQGAETRAAMLRSQALDYVRRTGYAPEAALTQVLGIIPAHLQADQSVMNLAMVIARGLGSGGAPPPVDLPGPAPAPSGPAPAYGPPVVSETAGRRSGPPPLSELERRVAQNRGISADKWRTLTDTSRAELE